MLTISHWGIIPLQRDEPKLAIIDLSKLEEGAKALFGRFDWEKNATWGNRAYCREKVLAIVEAMEVKK